MPEPEDPVAPIPESRVTPPEITAAFEALRASHPRLLRFAHAIQTFEGWKPGSLSFRNNNPGNMRWSHRASGRDEKHGFAIFPDYTTGLLALMEDVKAKAEGKNNVGLLPTSTLLQLISVWAPLEDNNDPLKYARFIAARLGLSLSTPISALLEPEEPTA